MNENSTKNLTVNHERAGHRKKYKFLSFRDFFHLFISSFVSYHSSFVVFEKIKDFYIS